MNKNIYLILSVLGMFLVIIPAMASGWKLTLSTVIFMSVGLAMSAFSTYTLLINDEFKNKTTWLITTIFVVLLINLGINLLRYLFYLLEGSMSIDYWLMFIMDGLAVFYVLFLAFIIIYVSVTFDILWFDSYGKRWGWI